MQSARSVALARIEEVEKNKLPHLDLSSFRLGSVPEQIGRLTHLESLNLLGNSLTQLPEFLGNLTRLHTLHLSFNALTVLPPFIAKLTKLRKLDLAYNRLFGLPEAIGRLAELQTLDLANNRLHDLPESMNGLQQLSVLHLAGNPALGLESHVIDSFEVAQVLDYYFTLRRGRRPLNEAKLILVGRGGVGKTSLVKRLVDGVFDPGVLKTDGIEIREWQLELGRGEQVRLHVWDFGGQEINHATHQFFMTQRSIYLLVLAGREGGEDADAEYWLKLIESFGQDSSVIVVLNKFTDQPFDLNRRALERRYSIREFINTDCRDGTGLPDLRRAIERETDRLEHLREPFPESWFEIKRRLPELDDHISFDAYRKFCAAHGEPDADRQNILATHLHHLGVILNYREDPRLQDTHVLNPHWVTSGIYGLLSSPRLQRQAGEIRLAEVAEILDPVTYPPPMRRFILDLMRRFHLCFSFPGDDAHFLIPDLLGKNEPEEVDKFNPLTCLNFQYRYTVVPEGLLPRFIVQTHALSEGLLRWRSGVIIQYEGNWALVRADPQQSRVFISVDGPLPGRRHLLSIIRANFNQIHRDIKALNPQELVPIPGHPDLTVSYEELTVREHQKAFFVERVVGGEVLTFDVRTLLNGVGARDPAPARGTGRIRLFISYSHRDEPFREEMEKRLKGLQRYEPIYVWTDRGIGPGEEWREKIAEHLNAAHVILLLVSADFLDSDFCYDEEMLRALKRHEAGTAVVLPIILRACNWPRAPFAKLQVLPRDGRAVSLWKDADSAWLEVEKGVEAVISSMRRTIHP